MHRWPGQVFWHTKHVATKVHARSGAVARDEEAVMRSLSWVLALAQSRCTPLIQPACKV